MQSLPWLRRFLSAPAQPRRSSKSSCRRLAFDQLENRLVPSTSATIVAPAGPFPEGTAINLDSTVVGQVGTTPSFAWTVSKNGTPAFATGTTTDGKFSFTPDDNASYVVSMSVTDDANTTAATDVTLTVDNAVPTAAISGPTTGTFGQPLTFTLSATDPSTADAALGFTYSIDWNNDGIVDETIPATANNGAGVMVTHTFTTPGDNTFSVTATDKDTGVSAPVTQTVSLTNGVTLVNGVLTIAGTNGADAIFIIPKGKPTAQNATVRVFMNGQNLGTFSGVNSITIDALDGNDFVHLAGSIRVNATVLGGAGDDRIKGGKGNDILVGGDGNDFINGGQGADIVIGGNGFDHLIGGPGDDLMIANATTFDADQTSLQTLQSEWLSSTNLAARVAAVTDASATVHLTSGTGGTILEDNATDRLNGASGKDAFFATVGSDIITGMHPFEFLNGVKGTAKSHGHGHNH